MKRNTHPASIIGAVIVALIFWGLYVFDGKMSAQREAEEQARAEHQATVTDIKDHAKKVWTTESTVRLASMASDSRSVYVTRVIQDHALRYVEKLDDGGFAMGSIAAEDVVVYETDDGSTPRIEFQSCSYDTGGNAEWERFFDKTDNACGLDSVITDPERVRVYVPKGTVADEFSVGPAE